MHSQCQRAPRWPLRSREAKVGIRRPEAAVLWVSGHGATGERRRSCRLNAPPPHRDDLSRSTRLPLARRRAARRLLADADVIDGRPKGRGAGIVVAPRPESEDRGAPT
jgi:hypothetical protein